MAMCGEGVLPGGKWLLWVMYDYIIKGPQPSVGLAAQAAIEGQPVWIRVYSGSNCDTMFSSAVQMEVAREKG